MLIVSDCQNKFNIFECRGLMMFHLCMTVQRFTPLNNVTFPPLSGNNLLFYTRERVKNQSGNTSHDSEIDFQILLEATQGSRSHWMWRSQLGEHQTTGNCWCYWFSGRLGLYRAPGPERGTGRLGQDFVSLGTSPSKLLSICHCPVAWPGEGFLTRIRQQVMALNQKRMGLGWI